MLINSLQNVDLADKYHLFTNEVQTFRDGKKRIIKFEAYFSIHSNNVSKTNQRKVPLAYFRCMGEVEFRTSEDIRELRS